MSEPAIARSNETTEASSGTMTETTNETSNPVSDETSNQTSSPPSDDAIGEAVRAIVAESLGRPITDVQLTSVLMAELGAESLDFLDIVFRIEREFKIEITRGEMERAARGDMTPEEFAPSGVISEAGLARLRELMPEAADRIGPGLRPSTILSLFSTRTFANMVIAKRDGRSA
jgi:acyl carrier protein